jgi:hypothetical protein
MNREVNSFVGWAIKSMRTKWNQSRKREALNLPTNQADAAFDLLGQMYMFHHKAVLDEEYLQKYYSKSLRLLNCGWLTLVSKEYFPFGLHLMQEIRAVVNQDAIKLYGNDIIDIAFKSLEQNKSLKDEFLAIGSKASAESGSDSELDDEPELQHEADIECKLLVYKQLISKVFHACAGAETSKYKRRHLSRRILGAAKNEAFRPHLSCISGAEAGKRRHKSENETSKKRIKR